MFQNNPNDIHRNVHYYFKKYISKNYKKERSNFLILEYEFRTIRINVLIFPIPCVLKLTQVIRPPIDKSRKEKVKATFCLNLKKKWFPETFCESPMWDLNFMLPFTVW